MFLSAAELPYKSIADGGIVTVVVDCVYCLYRIGEEYQNNRPAKHSLKLPETDVRMIQIDCPRRRVHIKFNKSDRALSVLQEAAGLREFRHDTGELSLVHIDWTGMGVRRIRLTNLPLEVPDRIIRGAEPLCRVDGSS